MSKTVIYEFSDEKTPEFWFFYFANGTATKEKNSKQYRKVFKWSTACTECVNVDAILIGINFHILIIIIQNPSWNVDEIDHKTRNVTFNDGSIST